MKHGSTFLCSGSSEEVAIRTSGNARGEQTIKDYMLLIEL